MRILVAGNASLSDLILKADATPDFSAAAIAHFAKGDPALAIELRANSRGDTDTTATMAGGICGGDRRFAVLPADWRAPVAEVNAIDVLASTDKLERAATL